MTRPIIWSCWFQGEANAPEIVRKCFSSWRTKNPGWEFRVLDAHNIKHYVDIDDYVDLNHQTMTAASLSDLVRVLLLNEYGGVWVDATTWCNRPLDEWLEPAASSGFFAFEKPTPDRTLSSWFIASRPGNSLISAWAGASISYWKNRSYSDDYFWFHNRFDTVLRTSPTCVDAWADVPKVSAGPPHEFQGRMYEPADEVWPKLDWSVPVFKLTHRLAAEKMTPECALRRLLREMPATDIPVRVSSQGLPSLPVVGLKVSTENLGDHIQILSADRLQRRFGAAPGHRVDRDDDIASATALGESPERYGILINGWHKTNPAEWPPHPLLVPIYLGFHTRLFQAPSLVGEDALEHYRKNGPIGCRDEYTLALLRRHGVDATHTNCLSLLTPRRFMDQQRQQTTFVVSRDERLTKIVPESLGKTEYICHYSGTRNFEENMEAARCLLDRYRNEAKLIITTLLHCALPAIAMGIPVVVFYPDNDGDAHKSDKERFSTLSKMVKIHRFSELADVRWSGTTVDTVDIKLALIDAFRRQSADKWGIGVTTPIGPIASPSALPVPG